MADRQRPRLGDRLPDEGPMNPFGDRTGLVLEHPLPTDPIA